MSGRLLCPMCGGVIGVYERLLVVSTESARTSSLAREPQLRGGDDVVIHHACGADVGIESDAWSDEPLT